MNFYWREHFCLVWNNGKYCYSHTGFNLFSASPLQLIRQGRPTLQSGPTKVAFSWNDVDNSIPIENLNFVGWTYDTRARPFPWIIKKQSKSSSDVENQSGTVPASCVTNLWHGFFFWLFPVRICFRISRYPWTWVPGNKIKSLEYN